MKSRTIYYLLPILLFAQLFFTPKTAVARLAVVVSNSTLCSGFSTTTTPCYTSVQNAINDAMAGVNSIDTIEIHPGSYTVTNATINNGITIYGTNTARTFLNGGGGTSILSINATTVGVTIRNLTFCNSQKGIIITNAGALVQISNNIFEVGLGSAAASSTAIQAETSSSANIFNNVFYLNTLGVVSNTPGLSGITNNIFIQNANGVAISPTVNLSVIKNNLFNGGIPGPPNIVLNNTDPNFPNNQFNLSQVDPLFVDPDNGDINKKDFHLRSLSPCINAGSTSVGNDAVAVGGVTAGIPDIGVYGGPASDIVPNTIPGSLSYSAPTPTETSTTLSWNANPDYNVQGYRIYYGNSPLKRDGTDATQGTSPIDALNVTTFFVSGLTRKATDPTVSPVITSIAPQNGSLIISWTAVPDAASYNIYHVVSGTTTTFPPVNTLTNATSYTLGGLTNGVFYDIQVSGVAQAAYFFSVTAYYQTSNAEPGVAWESVFSPEQQVNVGTPQEGPLSAPVQGAPDILVPTPNLKNSGCFIATAAFDSADAPPVRVLRAFRDRVLATNGPGRAFIRWYYRTSPALAEKLNAHPALKPLVRMALEPVVAAAFVVTEAPFLLLLLPFSAAAAVVLIRRRPAGILRS